jgi:tetrahydromethanopterin S-methyltransferase subunit E
MQIALYAAAFLALVAGVVHSYLGERYILGRLLRWPEFAKVFRDPVFIARVLRLAWHATSIAWWGFAAILALLAQSPVSSRRISLVVGVSFLVTSVAVLVGSRGKHLGWPLFLTIALVALYSARA